MVAWLEMIQNYDNINNTTVMVVLNHWGIFQKVIWSWQVVNNLMD